MVADIPPSQTLPETPPPPIPKSKLPPSKRNQPQLPPKLTLAEHELSPSAVLSVRFDEAELNRTDTRVLRPELLERAEELPVPAASTESAVEASKVQKVEEVKPEGKSGGGKMPKWFKGPGSEFCLRFCPTAPLPALPPPPPVCPTLQCQLLILKRLS